MRNRALRPIATLLSLLLITSTTVQAGPISIGEVVQVIGRSQDSARGQDLRFRNDSPAINSLVDESVTKSATGSPVSSRPSSETPDGSTPAADSVLSGVALSPDDAQGNLDVISQGDLEGSICDCGEIPGVESHGGFPKWPLLFLAAIPFFFIHHDCDSCDNTPPPTPTPTPPGVPEPASMFLMGSGLAALAASLRRRRARNGKAIAAAEEA